MAQYTLHRKGREIRLLKDDSVYYDGVLGVGLSTYGFTFNNGDSDKFSMTAKGFFFWRRINLFKNNEFVEEYKRTRSVSSKFSLKHFLKLYVDGSYLFTINRTNIGTKHGIQYMEWSSESEEEVLPIFCLCVLKVIDGMQGVNGTAGI